MTNISRRNMMLIGTSAAAVLALPVIRVMAGGLREFAPSGSGDVSHAEFDALLKKIVRPDGFGYNRVDYRALKGNHRILKAYLAFLEQQSPSSFSTPGAYAFWINLYNAKTLDIVADHFPVSSIKKINLGGGGLFGSGPWSKKITAIEGSRLSLDDIEHDIIRVIFRDPMSHYALNCASYSCPNLAMEAYTAANLEALMWENAVAYVNHKRGIDADGENLTVSKIYRWYASDFGRTERLKEHWSKFADSELQSDIGAGRISGYVYDWTLNDF